MTWTTVFQDGNATVCVGDFPEGLHLEIEVGAQPEGDLYTDGNPKGVTGDGSLRGLRAIAGFLRGWVPAQTRPVIAAAGDESRASAYRWLARLGFVSASEWDFSDGNRVAINSNLMVYNPACALLD